MTIQHEHTLRAKLELSVHARLGEGALWHPIQKVLYWVDIEGKQLHIYDPVTGKDRALDVGQRIGTVVPLEGGGALVALQDGIYEIDTETGDLKFILNPIQESDIRFNDGKCDPAGRFWVGTMALDTRKGAAKLYRLNLDGSIEEVLKNLTISNGIIWSPDKCTMYFTDTPTHEIRAYEYNDETGGISHGKVVISIPQEEGIPDGMTIDADGNLWVALHGAGAVGKYDPVTGKLLQKVEVPACNVTSCAFGGDKLDILYITSAKEWLSEEKQKAYPLSGNLFSVKPGVRGIPANFYKGKIK
ncbi:SMP-30/gluconolactonase/LRE family protein [Pontibacter sp. MBLB2868]|uniref:SMP-30/gluconolactonase/LRE family protein n=1 Tax=Pontibacter sp. MBLB2868 TaxID=3451555 RepID=UPI003F75620A